MNKSRYTGTYRQETGIDKCLSTKNSEDHGAFTEWFPRGSFEDCACDKLNNSMNQLIGMSACGVHFVYIFF